MQRKITRILFFKQFPNADVIRPPYSNRLIDLDIIRVEDALKIQRLILGFKILGTIFLDRFMCSTGKYTYACTSMKQKYNLHCISARGDTQFYVYFLKRG